MTLKEIKLAREVWPPNIEKILEHYKNAKKIMPSNYEIYKDKARLFYVLRDYRKFHEEIKQWKKIADGKWSKYIEDEIDFLTTTNRSKITPWEHSILGSMLLAISRLESFKINYLQYC